MITLNYYIHLLLTSKYKILIHLIFILFVYLTFYGYNYAFCMNNTNNIIEAPVNEVINSQAEDLRREISAYAESHASLLEEIDRKNQLIQSLLDSGKRKSSQILELRRQNGALGRTIHELRENVANLEKEADDYYYAYKEQCKLNGHLGHRISELKQRLQETRTQRDNYGSAVSFMGDVIANLRR